MASTTGKYEWVVIIPDHEGVLDKRMEVRPCVNGFPRRYLGMLTEFKEAFRGLEVWV